MVSYRIFVKEKERKKGSPCEEDRGEKGSKKEARWLLQLDMYPMGRKKKKTVHGREMMCCYSCTCSLQSFTKCNSQRQELVNYDNQPIIWYLFSSFMFFSFLLPLLILSQLLQSTVTIFFFFHRLSLPFFPSFFPFWVTNNIIHTHTHTHWDDNQ